MPQMPPAHPFDDDKLREECGIFGVLGAKDAANFVALGLHALQHRGQEAGGIVALFGVDCYSGDTFTSGDVRIAMTSIHVPDPVISLTITPRDAKAQANMSKALRRFTKEDPTFRLSNDAETGETVIAGMGELHLEVYIERMKREYQAEVETGAPQVAYRETISQRAEFNYTHKKQTGGSGQFADVTIMLEPGEPGEGYSFDDKISGGRIPKEYIGPVDQGIQSALSSGVLAGFPLIDVKATLLDGSFHDVDSSEMAFKIAGTMAFKEASRMAKPVLLEPIMAVEVVTPEDYMGDVMGDLSSRRGKLGGQESRGNAVAIKAEVPLSEMFGYSNSLRGMSQGRASYAMEPLTYREVPNNIAKEILEKQGEDK